MKSSIYFFVGTTAELLKIFPVMREFERRKIKFKIITSGQTSVNFAEISPWVKKKEPDIVLPKKSNQSSMLFFLIWTVKTLFTAPWILSKEFSKIDKTSSFMIVHGDTVSSLLGTVIAKLFKLKVVHIESGLRSFNFLEPFPEELTRSIISKFADIHFCPNEWSLKNLNPTKGVKVNTFQNTFIESYYLASERRGKISNTELVKGKYFVFILHRQEHVIFNQEGSRKLMEFILDTTPPNLKCIFIKHSTTRSFLKSLNQVLLKKNKGRIVFLPRLGYTDFVHLLSGSEFLISDGGGNQEEAYYMGLPCLVLRDHTERIEGLGENAVLAKSQMNTVSTFISKYKSFRRARPKVEVQPSKIIVDFLVKEFKI